jgi:hypothetical protein
MNKPKTGLSLAKAPRSDKRKWTRLRTAICFFRTWRPFDFAAQDMLCALAGGISEFESPGRHTGAPVGLILYTIPIWVEVCAVEKLSLKQALK